MMQTIPKSGERSFTEPPSINLSRSSFAAIDGEQD